MNNNSTPRAPLQQFAELLQKQRPAIQRFSIDANHYAADAPEMLRLCYQAEVERRGRKYREDEATLSHISKVAKWLTGGSTKAGLFLYGAPGNGKTTMANAMKQLITMLYGNPRHEQHKEVISISALQLANIVKEENAELLRTYKHTDLLHIDDVGTEPASIKVWGNEVSPLVEILYSRYDLMLYTVITSNLGDEDILPRYGQRIADRFREMFDFLNFNNPSYRY